jgi:GNAT superfamily N-acetyltransferase
VEVRPAADEELPRVVGLWNRELPRRALSLADFAGYLHQFPQHELLLALEDDTLVGAGSATFEALRPYPIVRIVVDSSLRGRGAGGRLFDALSAWARGQGHETLEAWIDDDQEAAIAFARARGAELVGHDRTLELDLRGYAPPSAALPAGIRIVRWAERPELAAGIYEVACEAYADIPGEEDSVMEPFADWLAHDMRGEGDTPEAVFVALAGEDVVGYSKFSLSAARPTVAIHDLTGVRRAWRGRGIARALKATQIAWAKEQGYERLETRNEDRNVAIARLNEDFGYRPGVGRGTWRGPVSAATRSGS